MRSPLSLRDLPQLPCMLAMLGLCLGMQADPTTKIPSDPSFTPESTLQKERKYRPYITMVESNLPEGVVGRKDIVYRELRGTPYGDRFLHLDLFHPAERKEEDIFPAVVLVHGGGWRSGSKRHQVPMAQHLAAAGYVSVAVEYRLALEALYPASVHDLKAVVRWLRTHAAEYGVDPDHIAILGCSSGAHLASLVGLTSGHPALEGKVEEGAASSDVQAVINIDGVVSFIHPEAEAEIRGNAASTWLGARYEEHPELWKQASPLEHVGSKAPPFLFVNSSIPRFHAGRDALFQRLDALGVYHEVHTLSDTPHPFWLLHPWFEPTVQHVRQFLDRIFKGHPSGEAASGE